MPPRNSNEPWDCRDQEAKTDAVFRPSRAIRFSRLLAVGHEKIRRGVCRIYVASSEKELFAQFRLSLIVTRNAESDSHTNGIGKQPLALVKDFGGRLKCAVKQQFGSPGKQIGLARLQFRRELIFTDGFE